MKNEKRIPFESIEKVVEGETEAMHNVVCHYRGYMKYLSVFQGHYNSDIQDRLEAQLIQALFKYRFR